MNTASQNLTALLEGTASGVFRFLTGTAPAALPDEALRMVVISARAIRDKPSFLKACAKALDFPAWFGHNWDAFYDCVADQAATPGRDTMVVFDDLSGFARTEPDEFDAAIDALSDAAQAWQEQGRRLLVLVGLAEPLLAPELPLISLR